MIRLICLTLFLLAPLALAPKAATAVPVADQGLLSAAPRPAAAGPAAPQPIARARLVASDMALLPSGKLVLGPASPRPLPLRATAPAAEPVTLPLPGSLTHFVVALAGLAFVARKGRAARSLADRKTAA